jgi:anion-transporting  ArsA/GET3 family ATPase
VAAQRLVIVTGKGGTGRSAVTAALALRAAASGLRTLAISMTPSPGLALHLGRTKLAYEAVEVSPGLFALSIDRRQALNEYVHRQLRMPRRAPLGAVATTLNGIADTVPGIRDAITIGKVVFESWSDHWDVIVADGPPTGQILSYLSAPSAIADLVPAGLVKRQAEAMREQLDDPSTEVVITTLAEELPVTETTEALADLAAAGFTATVVANRIVPELTLAQEPGTGPPGDAARLHLSLRRSQQRWRAELPEGPELPYLFGLHTPSEVSARLAEELDL